MVVVEENKTFSHEQMKLLTLDDETKSIDGKHYVCKVCRDKIRRNKIPPCNEVTWKFRIKNLPPDFLTAEMTLSKFESHLLTLVIPFIRIAHVPGYGQFKVKGPMITIEADVQKTMDEKILPRKQELIPVSLKRKLIYKGSVIEEIVSKSKVKQYFKLFKENNPLFVDEKFDEKRIGELIKDLTGDP